MRFKLKLKNKLLLVSVGMVFILSLIVLFQFEKGIEAQKESVTTGFGLYSEGLSNSISQVFYSQYNNVQAFTKNESLRKIGNPKDIIFVLNEVVTLYPLNDLLILVDMKGKYIASNSIDPNGKKLNVDFLKGADFSSEKWFTDTKSEKLTENYKKKIFGSRVGKIEVDKIVSKAYGEDKIGNHFTAIIESEYGDPLAILTSFSNIKWIQNEMKALSNQMKSSGIDAEIAVLNKEGKVSSFLHNMPDGKNSFQKDLDSFLFKKSFYENHQMGKDLGAKKPISRSSVGPNPNDHSKNVLMSYRKISNPKFLEKIGWSVVVMTSPDSAFSKINNLNKIFLWTLGVVFIICALVAFVIVNKLNLELLSIVNGLKGSTGKTEGFVGNLINTSKKVSDMATSQASAIEETAATLDELSGMIQMSAQNAKDAVKVSKTSQENAEEGKVIVTQVMDTIHEIKDSNDEVLNQTTEGNKRINEIVSVINEISAKTRVINDIVFQTKLLSFNASVEAARAGEHGKGFAVVAEEVGNLAQMSGTAASDISAILEESISKVETIVKENQDSIERIMVKSKDKVEQGILISGKCTTSLDNIVRDVKLVSDMAQEISRANQEQESGISNISDAMNQLRDNTNTNTLIADETLVCSDDLSSEVSSLNSIMYTLETDILGTTKEEIEKINRKEKKKEIKLERKSNAPDKKSKSKENKKTANKSVEKVAAANKKIAKHDNVVSMEKAKERKKPKDNSIHARKDVVADAGTDTVSAGEVPSWNDPRFEDI